MEHEDFYQHHVKGDVHTYTHAKWHEDHQAYVHHLISETTWSIAVEDGLNTKTVTE